MSSASAIGGLVELRIVIGIDSIPPVSVSQSNWILCGKFNEANFNLWGRITNPLVHNNGLAIVEILLLDTNNQPEGPLSSNITSEGWIKINDVLYNNNCMWFRIGSINNNNYLLDAKIIQISDTNQTNIEQGYQLINTALSMNNEYIIVRYSNAQSSNESQSPNASLNTSSGQIQYRVNDMVDCLDTVGAWLEARIIEVDTTKEMVFVHFEGWADKWNEWLSYKNKRLARYRSHTAAKGNIAERPFNLKVEENGLDKTLERLKPIVATINANINSNKPLQQLLNAGDFAFVSSQENVKYLGAVVNSLVEDVTLLNKAQLLLKYNIEIVIYCFKNEIPVPIHYADSLLRICGGQQAYLYQHYYNQLNDKDIHLMDENKNNTVYASRDAFIKRLPSNTNLNQINLPSQILIANINYFGFLGGFELIEKQLTSNNTSLPTVAIIIRCLAAIRQYLDSVFLIEYIPKLKLSDLIRSHLSSITDEDLKALDKRAFAAIIADIQQLLLISSPSQPNSITSIQEFHEEMQLNIALRMLKAQVLATRIEGITQLENAIKAVAARDQNQNNLINIQNNSPQNSNSQQQGVGAGGQQQQQQQVVSQFLTSSYMCDWLENNSVVELILGRDSHEQIVKRSPIILKFLSIHHKLTSNHLALLWSAAAGKHEGLVRIVYDLIADLASVLNEEQLETVWNKVQEKPIHEYKEFDINFLRNFTQSAVKARELNSPTGNEQKKDKRDKNAVNNPPLRWYALEIFWNILQGNNVNISTAISTAAAQALANLLGQPEFKSQLTVYLDKCLNTLTNNSSSTVGVSSSGGNSLTQQLNSLTISPSSSVSLSSGIVPALSLSQLIISQQPEQSNNKLIPSRAELIEKLDSEKKILNVLIENLVSYEKNCIGILLSNNSNNSDPIIGGHPHSIQLSTRFNFIQYLLSNSKLQLNQTQIDLLWNQFISQGSTQSDQNKLFQFLQVLVDGKDGRDKKEHLYAPNKVIKYIYLDLLGNPNKFDYSNLSMEGFQCFQSYFIHYNHSNESLLTHSQSNIIVVNHSKLAGLESLWTIALVNKTNNVQIQATNLLITLHLRLDFLMSTKEKRAILKSFVDKSMNQLQNLLEQANSSNPTSPSSAATQTPNKDLKKKDEKKSSAGLLSSAKKSKDVVSPLTNSLVPLDEYNTIILPRLLACIQLLNQFLHRLHIGDLAEKPKFSVGQIVKATWKTQRTLYDAKVIAVNRDGSYSLHYADGDKDPATPEKNLHTPESVQGKQMLDPPNTNSSSNTSISPDEDTDSEASIPRQLLANDSKYFELLFKLLGQSHNAIAQPIAELLGRLPVNQQLAESIKQLGANMENKNNNPSIDWNNLLPYNANAKLKYTLQVIKTYAIIPPINPQPQQQQSSNNSSSTELSEAEILRNSMIRWCENFVWRGGLKHIYSILTEFSKIEDYFVDHQSEKTLSLLLELLHNFLPIPSIQKICQEQNFIDHSKLANKLLQIATITTQYAANQVKTSEPNNSNVRRTVSVDGELNVLYGLLIHHSLSCVQILLFNSNKLVITQLEQFNQWEVLIEHGVNSNLLTVRFATANNLFNLVSTSPAELLPIILPKALNAFKQFQSNQNNNNNNCVEYFELLKKLLSSALSQQQTNNSNERFFDSQQLLLDIADAIKTHHVMEESPAATDNQLCGLFQLATQLIQSETQANQANLKQVLGNVGLVTAIFHCLFDVPNNFKPDSSKQEICVPIPNPSSSSSSNSDKLRPPICKSAKSRDLAFNLLSELSSNCESNAKIMASECYTNHLLTHSGGARLGDWNFEPRLEERISSVNYLGLQNLGCICYMNAPLQQLFMIPQLRANLLAIDEYKETDLTDSLLYQSQQLFALLQESEQTAISPAAFCHAFKDMDGKPTDVRVQDDSGGFVQKLLDRLCMITKGTKYEQAIPSILGGQLCHELIGRGECTHYRERGEEFYGLSVEVQNKSTLEESLKQFIEGEVLEGGNAYRCDKCNKKVDTTKRTCIKKLPPTIFFILKRFALDYNTMETTKINDKLEFPTRLNLKPYTQGELPAPTGSNPIAAKAAAEAAKVQPNADGKESSDGKSSGEPFSPTTPNTTLETDDSEYEYVLRGVVVHTGSANGGHYYSFIQERTNDPNIEGNWYKFNDSVVTPFDPKDIPDETYGGVEESPQSLRGLTQTTRQDGNTQQQTVWEKYRNAYLIFYDRVQKPKPDQQNSQLIPITSNPDSAVYKLFESIWRSNINHWRDKAVYDKNYFDFLGKLVHGPMVQASNILTAGEANNKLKAGQKLSEPIKGQETYLQLITQLTTRFVLTTLARARAKEAIANWLDALKKLFAIDISLNVWLLQQFINPHSSSFNGGWAIEFLLACPDLIVRSGVVELINQAIQLISPYEQHTYLQSRNSSGGLVVSFINYLMEKFNVVPGYWRNFDPYFRVVAHFSNLGKLEARWILINYNLYARLLDFFLGDQSIHTELNNFPTNSQTGKRLRMADEFNSPDLINFNILLANLTVHCKQPNSLPSDNKLVPDNPSILNTVSVDSTELVPLTPSAIDLLLYSDYNNGFLVHLLQLASTKKRSIPVIQMLIHWATDNQPVSSAIINCIKRGLEWFDYDGCRSYFRILWKLIELNDSIQEKRVENIIHMLTNLIAAQAKYWKITDFSIEFLCRFARKSSAVQKVLHENTALIQPAIQFLQQFPEPPPGRHYTATSGVVALKESNSSHSIQRGMNNFECYGLNSKAKLQILEGIAARETIEIATDLPSDSDLDFSDRILQLNEWIDCLDTANKWLCAQVVKIYQGNKAEIHFDGWTNKWNETLDFSSPRIRKLGTFTTKQQIANIGKPREPKKQQAQQTNAV